MEFRLVNPLWSAAAILALLMTNLPAQPGGERERPERGARLERLERARGEDRQRPFLAAASPQFAPMLRLAFLSEEQLEKALPEWPRYQQMDGPAQGRFRRHLERFRENIRGEALAAAEEWGITLQEDRRDAFIRSYWHQRMAIEQRVRQAAEAELERAHGELRRSLGTEFSTAP